MSALCPPCRIIARQCVQSRPQIRLFSMSRHQRDNQDLPDTATKELDLDALLSKPTWSVRSLLPPGEDKDASTPTITPKQLHHLLRLSALPPPKSPQEEASMIKTLQTQLHFVKEIQKVDTTGVDPLVIVRDETEAAIKRDTIDVESLKEAFAEEEIKGRNKRPRRRKDIQVDAKDVEDWDVMGMTSRKVGGYFVVDSSKGRDTA